jgi:hypothetical protein
MTLANFIYFIAPKVASRSSRSEAQLLQEEVLDGAGDS